MKHLEHQIPHSSRGMRILRRVEQHGSTPKQGTPSTDHKVSPHTLHSVPDKGAHMAHGRGGQKLKGMTDQHLKAHPSAKGGRRV